MLSSLQRRAKAIPVPTKRRKTPRPRKLTVRVKTPGTREGVGVVGGEVGVGLKTAGVGVMVGVNVAEGVASPKT